MGTCAAPLLMGHMEPRLCPRVTVWALPCPALPGGKGSRGSRAGGLSGLLGLLVGKLEREFRILALLCPVPSLPTVLGWPTPLKEACRRPLSHGGCPPQGGQARGAQRLRPGGRAPCWSSLGPLWGRRGAAYRSAADTRPPRPPWASRQCCAEFTEHPVTCRASALLTPLDAGEGWNSPFSLLLVSPSFLELVSMARLKVYVLRGRRRALPQKHNPGRVRLGMCSRG